MKIVEEASPFNEGGGVVASEEVDGMSCYKFPQGDGGIKGYGVSVDRELIEAVTKALAAGEVRKEVVGTHRYGRGGCTVVASDATLDAQTKVPAVENRHAASGYCLDG